MLNAAEKDRQNSGGMGTFQVGRGIPHHPYVVIRGNSRAVQRHENRVGCRFVALCILGAHRARYPAVPAKMRQLGPQIVADLVADDRDVASRCARTRQQRIRARQRLQALEMDAKEGVVEHLLSLAGAIAEQSGKEISQRAMSAGAYLGLGPRREAERRECVAIALDDGRPGIDQRVVPIEQYGTRSDEPVGKAHVTDSPASAKRTYSSRRRRAVGPGLPSLTFSSSILTT